MNLIELILSVALVGVLCVCSLIAAGSLTSSRKLELEGAKKDSENKILGIKLEQIFEGTRSFQNLRFTVPSSNPPLACTKVGFCVQPGVDVFGAPFVPPAGAPGPTVRFFVIHREVTASPMQLTAPPAGANVDFHSSDGVTPLSSLIPVLSVVQNAAFVVLSNVQSTELFQITVPPPSSSDWNYNLSPRSFSATYPPATTALGGTYTAGDFVYLASIFVVGIDPRTRKVAFSTLNGRVIEEGENVSSFSASFLLRDPKPGEDKCNGLTTPDYSNDWAALNSGVNCDCYDRISSVRISFEVPGRIQKYIFLPNG